MMNLILSYCRSQSLGAVARLGVPDRLKDGPKTADELAEATGSDPDFLFRTLRALAAEGVFEMVGERTFALNEMAEGLTDDHPRSLRWLAASMCDEAHWQPWGKAYDAIVEGKSQTLRALDAPIWEFLHGNPNQAGRFGQAMSNMSRQAIAGITASYDFSRFRHVVDVGGNRGTLVLDLLEHYPEMRATIFDLPPVIEVARDSLGGHPHADRVDFVGGSFFEEVPSGGDAYLLKHILHDWPDKDCRRILRTIREAIPDDGTLLVFDSILVPEAPPWAVWLDVHMMILQDGKERSPDEFEALFAETGFELDRAHSIPAPVAIIEARPV
jgi:hypothetical protein